MTETAFNFECLGYIKRDDGLIGRCHLEVTDIRSGRTETISVEPRHLASARSMKRILLDRCMLYSATRAKHNQMLLEMLDPQTVQSENYNLGSTTDDFVGGFTSES